MLKALRETDLRHLFSTVSIGLIGGAIALPLVGVSAATLTGLVLHEWVARVLSARLAESNRSLEALLE